MRRQRRADGGPSTFSNTPAPRNPSHAGPLCCDGAWDDPPSHDNDITPEFTDTFVIQPPDGASVSSTIDKHPSLHDLDKEDYAESALRELLDAPFRRITARGFVDKGSPSKRRESRPHSAIPTAAEYDFCSAAATLKHEAQLAKWSSRNDKPHDRPMTAAARRLFSADLHDVSYSDVASERSRADVHSPLSDVDAQDIGFPDSPLRTTATAYSAASPGGKKKQKMAGAEPVSLQTILMRKIRDGAMADLPGQGSPPGSPKTRESSRRKTELNEVDILRQLIEDEEIEAKRNPKGATGPEPIGAAIASAEALQFNDQPFVPEIHTGLPVCDVHNYLLYCQHHKVSIMLRPVADGAAQAFIGSFTLNDSTLLDAGGYPILDRTEHAPWALLSNITKNSSNAAGKTMSTSLKSSPYNPIKGCVPMVAQLSKVGAAQTKLKSKLEAALIEAEKGSADDTNTSTGGGDGGGGEGNQALTQVYARLKSMETAAVRIFNKIAQDSNRAMEASRQNLTKLMQQYQTHSMQATEKRKVSEMYLDEFNNSQFLGECYLRYGPLREVVHYVGWKPLSTVESWMHHTPYQENSLPVFVLCPPGEGMQGVEDEEASGSDTPTAVRSAERETCFKRWDEEKSEFVKMPLGLPENTYPVPVVLVSSRQFYISEDTGRIEERKEGAMLVPDYDGLSFALDQVPPLELLPKPYNVSSVEEVAKVFTEAATQAMHGNLAQRYVHGMGMVCEKDIEHVLDVRSLTGWRQNHGVESNNTVKTQEFTPGNYTCFDSDGKLYIVHNFREAIAHVREAWKVGCPLKLNPNWNVLLDREWLPIVPSDSVNPLYDLEGAEASFIDRIKNSDQEWDMPSIKSAYERLYLKERVEGWTGAPRTREGKKAQDVVTWRAYVKYRDTLKVVKKYFHIREILLYPPYHLHHKFIEERSNNAQYQTVLQAAATVRSNMREYQNTLALRLIEGLEEERRVFENKHGLKSTDFIDNIWDYLMAHELRCGFDDNSLVGVVEQANDTLFGDLPSQVVSTPLQVKATKTSKGLRMQKGADNKFYTPGEHMGIMCMKRMDAALQYTSHDPWSESRDLPVTKMARAEPAEVPMELFRKFGTPGTVGLQVGKQRSSLSSIAQRRKSSHAAQKKRSLVYRQSLPPLAREPSTTLGSRVQIL